MQSFRVTHREFPDEIDGAEFDPPGDYLKPDMIVSRPGERLKKVAKDGALDGVRAGDPMPTQRLPLTAIVIAAVCVVLVATWCFRRLCR